MKRILYLALTLIVAIGMTFTGTTGFAAAAEGDELLVNGGFETNWWEEGGAWKVQVDDWTGITVNNSTNLKSTGDLSLNYYSEEAEMITLSQDIRLEAGKYELKGKVCGAESSPEIFASVSENSESISLSGWGKWDDGSLVFDVSEAADVTVGIKLSCKAGGWGYLDDFSLKHYSEPDDPGDDPDDDVTGQMVTIKPIENMAEDFMRGVDISSVIAEEESGVKYYNQKGEEEDIFKILSDAGVNYVRVRVWNDPYDESGRGYGGGNNDLAKCIAIGQRAAQYNMKILVDLHYSDFWAYPSVQQAPKAWDGYSNEEIEKAIYDFTYDSVKALDEAGADVGMVQIGNETNAKMCGVTGDWTVIGSWMKAGCDAVKAYDSDIKTMLHFGSTTTGKYLGYVKTLVRQGVDFDVVGLSFYPYYAHGTMEDLKKNMNTLAETYNKEMVVVENSYGMSFDDSDGHPNKFGDDPYVKHLSKTGRWPVSVQGQAEQVRDIIELVNSVKNGKGTGYFYWEPAWITVGDTTGLTDDAFYQQQAANLEKWKAFGSGWGSEYAAGYYTEHTQVEDYYGGSSWDNQAMFDASGKALDSLNVFKYIYTGSEGNVVPMDAYERPQVTLKLGDYENEDGSINEDGIWKQIWWNQVNCSYNGEYKWTDVNRWMDTECKKVIAAYKGEATGTYTVHGIMKDDNNTLVSMTVNIVDPFPLVASYDRPAVKLQMSRVLDEEAIRTALECSEINCTYSDGSSQMTPVKSWNEDDIAAVVKAYKEGKVGNCIVKGMLSDRHRAEVEMDVRVIGDKSLIKSFSLSTEKYTYNGKRKKPVVTVTDKSGKELVNGTDYSVRYASGRTNVGEYNVIVSGKGDYEFSNTLTFKIYPKGTSITGKSYLKRSFKVKWAKQSERMAESRITGYQIRYSRTNDFAKSYIKTYAGYGTLSATVTNLKANQKYFVQVRTYKKIDGKAYYSSWSTRVAVLSK